MRRPRLAAGARPQSTRFPQVRAVAHRRSVRKMLLRGVWCSARLLNQQAGLRTGEDQPVLGDDGGDEFRRGDIEGVIDGAGARGGRRDSAVLCDLILRTVL